MIEDEYFAQFDEGNNIYNKTKSSTNKLPNWVSDKNSSLSAFNVIQSIFKERMNYIRRHKKKSHFSKKSTYHISKSEVARAVGIKKPNSLFNSVSVTYSGQLTNEINEKNKILLIAKDKAISQIKTGLNQKSKQDLISEVRGKNIYKNIAESRADELLELALEKMPLDTKRRLGLI